MKVRRVWWIEHIIYGEHKGAHKRQTDFPPEKSHEECAAEIYEKYGRYETNDH